MRVITSIVPLVRNPAWNTTRQRAGQVLAEAVVCGAALGVLTALGTVVVAAAGSADRAFVLWYGPTYAVLAAGIAGQAGALIGLLAGGAGLLLVRLGERRLGATTVASLLPVVALAVVTPIAVAVAAP